VNGKVKVLIGLAIVLDFLRTISMWLQVAGGYIPLSVHPCSNDSRSSLRRRLDKC